MQKTLTIEGPNDLHARLDRRAKQNHRSLDDGGYEATWARIRNRRKRMRVVDWTPNELRRKMWKGRP